MNEDYLAWLLFIAIWILFVFLRSRWRQKHARPVTLPGREPDLERTRRLFNLAEQKLGKLGSQDLMLRDFSFRATLSAVQVNNLQEAQTQLQSMLIEMLPHLHLLPNIRLIATRDKSQLLPGALGQYDQNGSYSTIRMLVEPGTAPELLVAALCHECTHYFMRSYMLEDPDRQTNEGLTDTMACLLGFSEIMLRSNSNRPLPYLNHAEFEEVRRCLLASRSILQEKYDRKQNLAAARAQLQKNLSGARAMIEQARAMISVNKTPNRSMSGASLSLLQQTLLALENGTYTETLRRAEAALSGDLSAVRRADDLYRMMLAFHG